MAWKVRGCTKQWNCNVKRVPHVPFTRMTPVQHQAQARVHDPYAYTYGSHGFHSA